MPRFTKLVALVGAGGAAFAALKRKRQGGASSSPPPAPTATAAAASPAGDVRTATPPPPETPGPSVTAPAPGAGSETEVEEQAEATAPDTEVLERQAGGPVDALVEEETAKAAAQAGAIGGSAPHDGGDPAMDPVAEAGGGEAEGFEIAEAELVEAASHGDGGGDPMRDAFTPEVESDLETVVHGEPDEEDVTEKVEDRDPKTGAPDPDDPGAGPGIAADR